MGHEHKAECVKKTNYDETTNMFIMGNQLFDKYLPDQSGFNILKIVTGIIPMQECFFSYERDGKIYRKVIDTKYQPFIKNIFAGNGVNLKKDIWKFLESLDIDIHCKGIKRELKLSDIYGFPTLTQEEGKTTRFFKNMKSLLEYIDKSSYVSIRGQKEFGKTALLKQIFKEYFQQKKFPVFLDIAKINTADGEELNRIIADKYQQTYESILPEEIMQKDSQERICIIDNIEEISLSDRNAKKLLEYVTNKFSKVILSRNHRLDLINPASYVELNDFIENKFGILVIQPVRKSYKERIVNKWLMLDDEGPDIGSPAFDAKRREKYNQIQTVMKGSYFNRTPIDLLLVLSYLDQDEPIQIDYSRYSFIYDKMILDKLNAIGNKETKSVFTYKTILQDIAFKMFQDGIQGYVNESYVIGAVLDYKETHSGFNMKSDELIRRLVNLGFLDCKNDTYRFKYSYMCYYFAGSYIDKRLHPDRRKNVIKDIFCNIDKDINYNIAIFLAYSVNIEHEILPIIYGLEENLLSEFRDFRYEEIGKLIEEWGGDIEKKVERFYVVPENENIPVLRERKLNELEDKAIMEELEEEKSDKSRKTTTDEDVRELNRDVIKISRLIDFMGNILKNYSGGMDNHPRESMIDLMFKSAIKIIGSFCSISMYIVDKLIEMLEKKIKEGDEEEIEVKSDFIEVTKFLFAEIWCQFISKNISALACSFDCEDIKGNLDAYCASKETEFVKMTRVEYLIRISSIKLPIKEIRNLFKGKEAVGDASQNIFKNNIYMYLRNYQFDNRDRQTVCSILGFDIKNMLLEEQKMIAIMDKQL